MKRAWSMASLARWRTYRYELIAGLNGAIIMVLEIVGARIIAPQFGSSVYVWTAVIGVILGAMSAGYWYGGRVADKGASDRNLSVILIMAAGVLLLCLLTRDLSLEVAAAVPMDMRVRALVAALLLFAPANFLMGMVSPYLAKLKVASVATVGASVGQLYAAGTLGSIMGTFAAGYWLISWLGNWALGLWLVVALLLASVLAERRLWLWWRLIAVIGIVGLIALPRMSQGPRSASVKYDGDSAYSRWLVVDMPWSGRPARVLVNDGQTAQSGVYLDKPDEPLFGYVNSFMKVAAAGETPRRVLLVGGGTYTLPKLLLDKYPEARVDVVEIDPKLDEIAATYFGHRPNARLRIIHEDGRTFLNSNHAQYDLVLMDAFSSMVPPFQLTTREAVAQISRAVAPGGVVAVNLIAARSGERAKFGAAEYTTYLRQFADVAMVPVDSKLPEGVEQNLMLVAGQETDRIKVAVRAMGAQAITGLSGGLELTDDYAPVEQMTAAR